MRFIIILLPGFAHLQEQPGPIVSLPGHDSSDHDHDYSDHDHNSSDHDHDDDHDHVLCVMQ